MGISSVVDAVEAVAVSVAALRGLAGGADDSGASDPLRDEVGECLDALVVVARLEAATAALKVRLVTACADAQAALLPPSATAREQSVARMSTVAELACALTISERAAGSLVELSRQLTTTLPLTLTALQGGAVSFQHAKILADETTTMDPTTAAGFEAHFLDPSTPGAARGCPPGELVPSQFRAKTRYWREHHHTGTIEQRHTRSAADRRLEYTPDRDGMAWLSAYLPAQTATSIWDRATAAARAQQNPNEPRTLTQLRADTAAAWLLTTGTGTGTGTGGADVAGPDVAGSGKGTEAACPGVAGQVPSPRAQVLVTVPVFALMGLTEEPAHLDGYGPIPPSMARELVAGGAESFHRVLTDPRDGTPLDISRTSYRIPTAMRRFLMLRDGKCRFPGCNNHSLDNETDHTTAWAHGGTTKVTNLQQLCRKHHHLKHHTTWTPTTGTGWTSPTGRTYPTETQQWQPATWPENILSELQHAKKQSERDPGPVPRAKPDQNQEGRHGLGMSYQQAIATTGPETTIENEHCLAWGEPTEPEEPTWTEPTPEPPAWLLEQSAAWEEFAAAHPELLEEFAAPPDHEIPHGRPHHHRTG